MMDPEVKTKWLEALRSGKYKQGTARLNKGDEYCCVGVLCDITDQPYHMNDGGKYYDFTKQHKPVDGLCVVPTNFYGIENVHVYYNMNDGTNAWRDNRQTFEQIADFIEKNE